MKTILIIAPHPDDAELGIGGTIAKLCDQGRRVVLLDLTRGERASRGTPEIRAKEAQEAARVLGVGERVCAGIPDGGILDLPDQRARVAQFIRQYAPEVLLAPMGPDRHPDHTHAHLLSLAANFEAGLHQAAKQGPHPPRRADHLFTYYPYTDPEAAPPLVVDVSGHLERKLEALRQYRSQFYNPTHSGPETMIATSQFWDNITTRAAYWGARIGVRYGEPLYATLPLNPEVLGEIFGVPEVLRRTEKGAT